MVTCLAGSVCNRLAHWYQSAGSSPPPYCCLPLRTISGAEADGIDLDQSASRSEPIALHSPPTLKISATCARSDPGRCVCLTHIKARSCSRW
jgi:hypothetical protein